MCSSSFFCSSLSDSRCLRSLFVRASSSSSTSRLRDSMDLRAVYRTGKKENKTQTYIYRERADRCHSFNQSIDLSSVSVLTCSSFSSCCRIRRSRVSSASVSWHFFSQSTFILTEGRALICFAGRTAAPFISLSLSLSPQSQAVEQGCRRDQERVLVVILFSSAWSIGYVLD